KVAFQGLSRSGRKRVKHQIDAIGLPPHAFEEGFDLLIAGNIAGKQWSFLSKLAYQFFDIFLYSLALVIENQLRPRGGPRLGDRPSDAALICDSEDKADFSCQNLLGHKEVKKVSRVTRLQWFGG